MKVVSMLIATALAGAFATQASAQEYALSYTTVDDGVTGPSVTVNAILDVEADPYTTNGYIVDAISGTRGGQSITSVDDLNDEIYYPATTLTGYSSATYVDSFGLEFTAGGVEFQLYRDPSDSSFYHEFENPDGVGTGRLISLADLSITPSTAPVPLPPTAWLMLGALGGLGLIGRRRKDVLNAAAA